MEYDLAFIHFGRLHSAKRDSLVSWWRCKDYSHREKEGGCWSQQHDDIQSIIKGAEQHSLDCSCWRHAIIDYVFSKEAQ